eukprot:CAMPEP_0174759666 /NCGR_PEP_ID=MMETSP1094-20130205/108385_1 /TAXON_ID=156173 /ORGANISM="Chrysochromulina brevifilum, Strain UTEX LB 985" /LENGTH=331 /DNA_ID=CAMNT_0015965603 /DNA_START=107 /DNA_END=1102 /DNA_ORIENTATION=-
MPKGGRGEPSEAEKREIEELRAMIGRAPQRESTLQNSTFMRWQVGEENRKKADEHRKEQERLKAEKDALDAKRREHAAKLKADALALRENNRAIKEAQQQNSQAIGREQRAKEAEWQEKREANAQNAHAQGRKLVEATKERQKRMDKAEANQDKVEREEGQRMDRALEQAFKAEKQEILEAKRAKVAAVKKDTDPSQIEKSLQWAAQKRTGSAQDKRKQQAMLKSSRRKNKEGHLMKAKAIKGDVNQIRSNAKAVAEQIRQKKSVSAGKERANDYLVEQEKLRVLAEKREEHAKVYEKRFATKRSYGKWENTSILAKPNLSSLDPSLSQVM